MVYTATNKKGMATRSTAAQRSWGSGGGHPEKGNLKSQTQLPQLRGERGRQDAEIGRASRLMTLLVDDFGLGSCSIWEMER